MVPTDFVFLDAFPLTPSGKVDEKALPDPVPDRSSLDVPYVAPRTPGELKMAGIWSRLLRVPEIGIHDDFFNLGGSSLLAVELLAEVRRVFGREAPMGLLASNPTVASMAAAIDAACPEETWRSLVPIRVGGSRTPFFFVHGGYGTVGSFPLLARQLPDDQPFYGLQWDGLDGSRGSRTVEAMAGRYLAEVRTVQAAGPYLFGGHCMGGLIAVEMAHQAAKAGDRVESIVMVDSPHLHSPRFSGARRRHPVIEILKKSGGRRKRLGIWLFSRFGWRIRQDYRGDYSTMMMIEAAWRYRATAPPTPTVYLATGLASGAYLGLSGSWDDGAMGWSPFAGESFRIARIDAEHNDVVHAPAAAGEIRRALDEAHGRVGRA